MNNLPREEMASFIAQSHESGATIVECIKAVAQHFELNLGQAKQAVASHPSWSAIAKANEFLHEQAIASLAFKNEEH